MTVESRNDDRDRRKEIWESTSARVKVGASNKKKERNSFLVMLQRCQEAEDQISGGKVLTFFLLQFLAWGHLMDTGLSISAYCSLNKQCVNSNG